MAEFDNFVDFVNNEMPKRPWAPVPLSGSLTAGQALIATGVGMEVEQKLVQFQDPLMVRYVGEQPGDYTTLASALASLPYGVDDLSNSYNYYMVYVRHTATGAARQESGGILIQAKFVSIIGLSTAQRAQAGLTYPTITLTDKSLGFGIKHSPFTLSNSGSLKLKDIRINASGSPTYPVTTPRYDLIEMYTTTGINRLILENVYLQFSASLAGAIPESTEVNLIYVSVTSTGIMEVVCDSGASTLILNIHSSFNALAIAVLKYSSDSVGQVQFTVSDIAIGSTINVTHGNLNGAPAQSYIWLRGNSSFYSISNVYFYFMPGGTTNNRRMTLFNLFHADAVVDITNVRITQRLNGAYFTNISGYSLIECPGRLTVKAVNCTHIITVIVSSGGIYGNMAVAKNTDAIVIIAGCALPNMVASQNSSIGFSYSIPSDAEDAVIDKIAKKIDDRSNGKNYLTQSPLPPAAPQSGDLWIETTEQY